jgi:hypothetical protein
MVATGSPERPVRRLRIDISPEEFAQRLAAKGHRPEEIERLWSELSEHEPPGRLFGLGPVIALYLGLILVVAASVSLLLIYWHSLGAGGILALGLAFFAASLVAGSVFDRKHLPTAAGVLEAVAVGWAGLVAYAVDRLVGGWPSGASNVDHVHVGLTTIAATGLATALVLFALRPDGVLAVPLALACGVLAIDGAELAFGNDLSPRQRVVFLVPLGLTWIAGGLWLDVGGKRPYATWTHWVGLATTAFAVMVLIPKTVPGFTVVGMLGAISLFFSAFVRHWSFTIIGAAGVLLATMSALGMLGGIAPLVIAVVGIALIFVGFRWSTWREAIRGAVLARLPRAARSFVTRLAPYAD